MSEQEMKEQKPGNAEPALESGEPTRRRINPVVVGAALLVLIVAAIGFYLYASRFESTDDAQIDGHMNPVAARIDGTIRAVHAEDNQAVKAGALLVELDPSDDQVALERATALNDQAQAQLEAANPKLPITRIGNSTDLATGQADVASSEAALAAARHDLASSQARLKEAEAVNERDQANAARYKSLFEKQETSRAAWEQAKAAGEAQADSVEAGRAAVQSAEKMVDQRQAQLSQAKSRLAQVESRSPLELSTQAANVKSQQANAEAARAALAQSRLNLAYCTIAAPVDGVVTQRSAEVGQRIARGQQLFMVVQTGDLWVTANFKETQLKRMHPGQAAQVRVDALGQDFDGVVESMPAVTGSRTSVLPPENATGNYVKVVQRLPVRIRLNPGQHGLEKLRPGMSVEPKVTID